MNVHASADEPRQAEPSIHFLHLFYITDHEMSPVYLHVQKIKTWLKQAVGWLQFLARDSLRSTQDNNIELYKILPPMSLCLTILFFKYRPQDLH